MATALRWRSPCSVSLVNTWSHGQPSPAHSETWAPAERRCAHARPSLSRTRPVSAWSSWAAADRPRLTGSHNGALDVLAGPEGIPRWSTGSHRVAGSVSSHSSRAGAPAVR